MNNTALEEKQFIINTVIIWAQNPNVPLDGLAFQFHQEYQFPHLHL
jgi:hypothetical protein